MEIVIGRAPSIRSTGRYGPTSNVNGAEATMLSIRPPRRREGPPPEGRGERRWANTSQDPANGRVITLLIPDGGNIPRDINSGQYRVFLRFVPRKA